MSNEKNCYPHIVREFKEAYLTMAREVKYRPLIEDWEYGQVPASEARAYAVRRAREDFSASLAVNGCVNVKTGRETLWLIEAAQLLCAAKDEHAIKLVELALQSLKQEQPWKPLIPMLLREDAEPDAAGPTRAWCPYCAKYHYHGCTGEDGHAVAHCTEGPFTATGYFLLTPSASPNKTKAAAHKMRRAK